MMRVYALPTGLIELDRASMVSDLTPGQRWTVPVMSFLVDHPRGRFLFDTGVHCQAHADPLTRLGAERMKRLSVKSDASADVVRQLKAVGLTPDDVRFVANSHLHFDHCGGNEFFPRATFLVQRPELESARQPAGSVAGYNPSRIDFEHALDYRMIEGEHDVFGDGSVVLIPTYGHTPGHQSVVIRDAGQQIVCASDACYTRENMDRDVLPTILWNPGVMRESLAALRRLRDKQGATMFYGHDPAQWEAAPRAPAAVL